MTEAERTREEEYVDRIEGLDAGDLAMLRRGCGERDPVEGRCPWLLSIIHGAASEPTAFLVASLIAQYKTADIRAGRHRIDGDFGITWRRAIIGSDSESIRRRFHILLDADYDARSGDGDLPHRLRQMVRYAASKGVGVDWPTLLTDLKFWNQSERGVQKRWSRSFFVAEHTEDVKTNLEEEE